MHRDDPLGGGAAVLGRAAGVALGGGRVRAPGALAGERAAALRRRLRARLPAAPARALRAPPGASRDTRHATRDT